MKQTKIRFSCNVRVDLINEKVVSLLKKAGCYAVWFGIECGNEKVRKDLLKRNMTQEQIKRTCKLFKKHSIKFATQNLIALPVDHPLKIDLETLDLNIECRPNYAWSSILYPYPSTPIYDYAVKNGYFEKKNWDKVAVTNKVVSELTFLDPNEKKQAERLHKIFGIIVEFPFLRPFVNILISLPLDKFYQLVFFGWNGYCLRIRMESWKKSPSDFFVLTKSLFNYLKNIKQQETFR